MNKNIDINQLFAEVKGVKNFVVKKSVKYYKFVEKTLKDALVEEVPQDDNNEQ